MSEIKALDKLREWSRWLDCTYATDDGESYIVYSHQPYDGTKSCGEYMREQCDEIEREIQERYMELPVDSYDVPIHVHDILECHANGYHGTFSVFAAGKNVVVGNHDIEWVRDNPSQWFHVASACTHVKPRTLKDVLEEYYDERGWDEADNHALEAESITTRYADEIRELLSGDAE